MSGKKNKIQITRKQHYVWRHYLREWATEDQIYSLLKKENKLLHVNLMGIAQQRDFYKIEKLSEIEYNYTRALIEKESHKFLLNENLSLLEMFNKLIELEDEDKLKNEINDAELFEALKITSIDNYQGIVETESINVLSMLRNQDPNILASHDIINTLCYFVIAQYLRTKKVKEHITMNLEHFSGKLNIANMWGYLQFTFIGNIAYNLSKGFTLKYLISDDNEFITSDQPVYNLLFEDTDEEGNIKSLDIYYPLTPKLAVRIIPDSEFKVVTEELNDFQVEKYNKFIYKNALNQVYATNKEQLEKYLM